MYPDANNSIGALLEIMIQNKNLAFIKNFSQDWEACAIIIAKLSVLHEEKFD